MTVAASPASPTSSSKLARPARTAKGNLTRPQQGFRTWQVVPVLLLALIGFLTLTPDGVAEPVQDFAGWLVIGGMATLAVMAIVIGLDRLLDCEGN